MIWVGAAIWFVGTVLFFLSDSPTPRGLVGLYLIPVGSMIALKPPNPWLLVALLVVSALFFVPVSLKKTSFGEIFGGSLLTLVYVAAIIGPFTSNAFHWSPPEWLFWSVLSLTLITLGVSLLNLYNEKKQSNALHDLAVALNFFGGLGVVLAPMLIK